MNQLNENLSVIRRQKAIYKQKLNKTMKVEEQKKLSEKIKVLSEEEEQILKQLGVKFESNN